MANELTVIPSGAGGVASPAPAPAGPVGNLAVAGGAALPARMSPEQFAALDAELRSRLPYAYSTDRRPGAVSSPSQYNRNALPLYFPRDVGFVEGWASFASRHGFTQQEFVEAVSWAMKVREDDTRTGMELALDFQEKAIARGWRDHESGWRSNSRRNKSTAVTQMMQAMPTRRPSRTGWRRSIG